MKCKLGGELHDNDLLKLESGMVKERRVNEIQDIERNMKKMVVYLLISKIQIEATYQRPLHDLSSYGQDEESARNSRIGGES